MLCFIHAHLLLASAVWQQRKALWESWPDSVYAWLWSQLVAASWHISRLLFFHILVIYLAGTVSMKVLLQGFYFSLHLPFFPFDKSLFLAFLTAPSCFSSLIIPSCVKLAVSHSQRNRLTFALWYCSHLVALKCLNIQNPTLHLRHKQISAGTISHLSREYTIWFAFVDVFYLFSHTRCWSRVVLSKHMGRCFEHVTLQPEHLCWCACWCSLYL